MEDVLVRDLLRPIFKKIGTYVINAQSMVVFGKILTFELLISENFALVIRLRDFSEFFSACRSKRCYIDKGNLIADYLWKALRFKGISILIQCLMHKGGEIRTS